MTKQTVPKWRLTDRLRRSLVHAGLKPQDMATELGVAPSTMTNYLNGTTRPGRAALFVWAIKCDVPLEWLAEDDDSVLERDSADILCSNAKPERKRRRSEHREMAESAA